MKSITWSDFDPDNAMHESAFITACSTYLSGDSWRHYSVRQLLDLLEDTDSFTMTDIEIWFPIEECINGDISELEDLILSLTLDIIKHTLKFTSTSPTISRTLNL